jgi:hypothetical protein
MRQPNNQPNERQRYLDSNLDVNPFEDGNTPENTIQGFIYTSEIDNTDYIDAYEGTVSLCTSEKGRTGNNDFYTIRVNYEIDNVVQEQFLGGQPDKSWSLIVNTHYTRLSKLNLVERQT